MVSDKSFSEPPPHPGILAPQQDQLKGAAGVAPTNGLTNGHEDLRDIADVTVIVISVTLLRRVNMYNVIRTFELI